MEFEGSSPELQAKANACEAPEGLLELAKEEGIELGDEDFENVSGSWRGQLGYPRLQLELLRYRL